MHVHPTAVIDKGARVGKGTRVWHFCHVMPEARIGADCVLGQNVFVGRGVAIGTGTKIQKAAFTADGARAFTHGCRLVSVPGKASAAEGYVRVWNTASRPGR